MTRYFGTDGIRGIANKELTCELAFALGVAAAEKLGSRLVVGRDTRRSGTMLESALVAGITAAGSDALVVGVVPTPAVAYFTQKFNVEGGVVISASHNPPEYNGLKLFDAEGFKLQPVTEDEIEQRLHELLEDKEELSKAVVIGSEIGTVHAVPDATKVYIAHAVESVSSRIKDLEGLKVAVDCGHGASAVATPQALSQLKAQVASANTQFNGDDINVGCGSTNLEPLISLVRQIKADIGIAHDGDADRLIAVDANGSVVDGDVIEMICARDMFDRGTLHKNTIVTTVMSNLGLIKAAEELDIKVIQTAVGDSNVLAAMREGGYLLGGEQSGHTIFLEHNTTGDGLITALQVLAIMKEQGKSLDELARVMKKYPQTLINVRMAENIKSDALEEIIRDPELQKMIAQTEEDLQQSGGGRVLVRASGTEPLIRVMVEAATEETAQSSATALAELVGERSVEQARH